METYTIPITLTLQQMAEIGHEYDMICRMEDVEREIYNQLEQYEKEDDINTVIINGKEIEKEEFLKNFDLRALAEDYEVRYEWDMNGVILMQQIVESAIEDAIAELE